MAYRKQELFATGPSEKDGLSKEIERMKTRIKIHIENVNTLVCILLQGMRPK